MTSSCDSNYNCAVVNNSPYMSNSITSNPVELVESESSSDPVLRIDMADSESPLCTVSSVSSCTPNFTDPHCPDLSQTEMEAIFGGDSPSSSQTNLPDTQQTCATVEPCHVHSPTPNTYGLIFDNLDKFVKSFDMRMDHQSESVHFVNAIAVIDRIDTSHLPCTRTSVSNEIDMKIILPTPQDIEALRKNFAVHIARILVEFMPSLSGSHVTRHIPHKYSKQMSKKSNVVCVMLSSKY